MRKMQIALEKEGYEVINYDYPSSKANVCALASKAISKALSLCSNHSSKIHFVTHSMGGILLRAYLNEHSIEKLGSVVMLGPPNQGSQIVDKIGGLSVFKWLNGPAGLELGTKGIVQKFKELDLHLGIIAGTRSIDPIGSMLLPWPNDGKVSVESTKMKGMKAHKVMQVTHAYMMKNPRVIAQVLHFLKHGSFF